MKIFLKKIYEYLIRFFELQLFLTLVSLPFMVAWGLPLSVAAPLANLIFNPVLALFLFLSSLIFFTELCYIPNQFLIWLLEILTNSWQVAIAYSSNKMLLALPWYTITFIWIVPFIAYWVIKTPRYTTAIIHFCIILITLWLAITILSPYITAQHASLECHRNNIEIRKEESELIVIDNGCFGSIKNPLSFVNFKLSSELIKQFGTLTIDHLICSKLTTSGLKTILTILDILDVKNIYIPVWRGITQQHFFRCYQALKQKSKKNGIRLFLVRTPKRVGTSMITPLAKATLYKDIRFHPLALGEI